MGGCWAAGGGEGAGPLLGRALALHGYFTYFTWRDNIYYVVVCLEYRTVKRGPKACGLVLFWAREGFW